ncbi:MAG: hypothetical protein AAF478_13360, partial [Pseudomonadota bacterium]
DGCNCTNGERYIGRIFPRRNDYDANRIAAWHEIHLEPQEEGPVKAQLEVFALLSDDKGTRVPLDINPDPALRVLTVEVPPAATIGEKIKRELSGFKSEIMQSKGDGNNSVEITYSIEIHEVE